MESLEKGESLSLCDDVAWLSILVGKVSVTFFVVVTPRPVMDILVGERDKAISLLLRNDWLYRQPSKLMRGASEKRTYEFFSYNNLANRGIWGSDL